MPNTVRSQPSSNRRASSPMHVTQELAPLESPLLSGPAPSTRLGRVLTLDLGSKGVALAVSRENALPRAAVVVTSAARIMMQHSKAGTKVDTICVHGSEIDPTLHPQFREIVENLRELRNKWFPKGKLCLLSDNPHLDTADVRIAVGVFDRPILSMEWGTAKTFASLTGRKSTELSPLVDSLRQLEQVVIQARFVRGSSDNSTESEVKNWIKRLTEVRPSEIQIIAAPLTNKDKKLRLAPKSRIEQIAAAVTEKTGIPAAIITDVAMPA